MARSLTTARTGALVCTEHEEQKQFVAMVEAKYPKEARLLYAIPNGANKSVAARVRFKLEGLRSGIPDLHFAYPTRKYHGLYIEMKRRHGGSLSEEQREYLELLRRMGYRAEVCKGCDEAWRLFEEYLNEGTGKGREFTDVE